jgi:D-mannonate dehydratase
MKYILFYINTKNLPVTVETFTDLPTALDNMVSYINSFNICESSLYVATSTDIEKISEYHQCKISKRFTTEVYKYTNGEETFVYDDGMINPDLDPNSRD